MFELLSQRLLSCEKHRKLLGLVSRSCCLPNRMSQLSVTNRNNQSVPTLDSETVDTLYKRVEIEARCADRKVLDSYQLFVTTSAECLGVTISRTWEPFRYIRRRTLLRAAFVKKKYRVQYEFRTYFRNTEFKHLTGSTADTLLEYIERNLPEGVALKVYRTAIEPIPDHISQTELIAGSSEEKKS